MSTLPKYDAVLRDFHSEWRKQEAQDGLLYEPGDCFVCEEDLEPPVLVGMFEPIPMPRDPYGCENPVSGDEE
jgi:hypothetical protein